MPGLTGVINGDRLRATTAIPAAPIGGLRGIPRSPAVVPLDLEVAGGSRLHRAICAQKAIKENLEWAAPADRPKRSASEVFEGLSGPGQLDHRVEWHPDPHFKFGSSVQERTGFPRALAGDHIAKLTRQFSRKTQARTRRSIGWQGTEWIRQRLVRLFRAHHSERRASTGLMLAARLAGKTAAKKATIKRANTDIEIETGSTLLVSNRRALAK